MQNSHPLAFLSKALAPKNLGLSIYEKEFLAIIHVVDKWRSYLLHNQFIIKTDHQSLKYLLEQKISTPVQHKYLTKLLGFDYRIEYKKGVENRVADALSRVTQEMVECNVLTMLKPAWMTEIQASYENDATTQSIILECVTIPYNMSLYLYDDWLLKFKGKLYLGKHKRH